MLSALLATASCGDLLGVKEVRLIEQLDGAGQGGSGGAGGPPGAGAAGEAERSGSGQGDDDDDVEAPTFAFVRIANFFAQPAGQKTAYTLCVRPVEQGDWQDPFPEGRAPLEYAQASDHRRLPTGLYQVRALPDAASCDGGLQNNVTDTEFEYLERDEYYTFAVVGDERGRPRLASYLDGRPQKGDEIEVTFAHAMSSTAEKVTFAPLNDELRPFAQHRRLAGDAYTLASVSVGAVGHTPKGDVTLRGETGYSLYGVSKQGLTLPERGLVVCENRAPAPADTAPAATTPCRFVALSLSVQPDDGGPLDPPWPTP